MHKIITIMLWVALSLSIIGIIVVSLFIGRATVDLNTWEITMGDWGRFIGFWVSLVFYWLLFSHIEKTGYKQGFKDGVKSVQSK